MAWKVQTNRIRKSVDNRAPSGERGYHWRWHKVREMKLRRDPLCEDCTAEGRTVKAEMVHHLDGNARHNDLENLVSLCTVCHGRRHSKDGHPTMGDRVGAG
jgi:5-methylcytosine-specific restriction endonuclease McrA